eukprot:8846558-Lingulodinium_polyedra.AAC.1
MWHARAGGIACVRACSRAVADRFNSGFGAVSQRFRSGGVRGASQHAHAAQRAVQAARHARVQRE